MNLWPAMLTRYKIFPVEKKNKRDETGRPLSWAESENTWEGGQRRALCPQPRLHLSQHWRGGERWMWGQTKKEILHVRTNTWVYFINPSHLKQIGIWAELVYFWCYCTFPGSRKRWLAAISFHLVFLFVYLFLFFIYFMYLFVRISFLIGGKKIHIWFFKYFILNHLRIVLRNTFFFFYQ